MDCEEIKITSNTAPDIAEIRNQVEGYMKPEVITIIDPQDRTEMPALLTRDGIQAINPHDFDGWRVEPRWRSGAVTAFYLNSLIELAVRFSDGDSLIFANNDRRNPSLTVMFDYHRIGADAAPRGLRHRAKFAYPLSDAWKAWRDNNGKPMTMGEFAAFLEDRIVEVLGANEISLNPEQQKFVSRLGGEKAIGEPGKLMEVATGLRVIEGHETVNAVNLSTGEAQISFKNEQTTGNMTVPRLFAISIPVFVNGEEYQILVRLRHRATGGQIKFFYELWRDDRVFDHAFDESIEKVKAETNLPVVLGAPEA